MNDAVIKLLTESRQSYMMLAMFLMSLAAGLLIVLFQTV
jgi:hypothetical protein